MKKTGFIKIILILVIAIVVLSLAGFSLADLGKNEKLRENFSFIKEKMIKFYDKFFPL